MASVYNLLSDCGAFGLSLEVAQQVIDKMVVVVRDWCGWFLKHQGEERSVEKFSGGLSPGMLFPQRANLGSMTNGFAVTNSRRRHSAVRLMRVVNRKTSMHIPHGQEKTHIRCSSWGMDDRLKNNFATTSIGHTL